MSDEDKELERLKAKRLAEMEKNISFKQKHEEIGDSKENKTNPSPREILIKQLGYRGMEVLQNAEFQFPNETNLVIEKLAELISSGEIDEQLDGGKLLLIFRTIGLNIRMQTKINVEQDGKYVSLSEKLSTKSKSENQNIGGQY